MRSFLPLAQTMTKHKLELINPIVRTFHETNVYGTGRVPTTLDSSSVEEPHQSELLPQKEKNDSSIAAQVLTLIGSPVIGFLTRVWRPPPRAPSWPLCFVALLLKCCSRSDALRPPA